MAQGMIMRRGGAAGGGLPEFTYTGTYSLLDDGDKNWRIKFLTSGTFTPAKTISLDVFVVGGGGGRRSWSHTSTYYAGGSGGGYTGTWQGIVAQAGTPYPIVIGAGGTGAQGGTSSAFNQSVAGGYPGGNSTYTTCAGANGGSGGAQYNYTGGSNGSDGGGANGGDGQGTTTREFGEATGTLYAGGGGKTGGDGGGGGRNQNGYANTGGGSGDGSGETVSALTGGSGIVIIRNHRAA